MIKLNEQMKDIGDYNHYNFDNIHFINNNDVPS